MRCLAVADRHPGSVGGVAALVIAATNAPDTAAGTEAGRRFIAALPAADLNAVAWALEMNLGRWRKATDLAAPLLARAKQAADHPQAGRLLASVCIITAPDEDGTPPPLFREAADRIADRHAASLGISPSCERLGNLGDSPPWAVPYERHLRAILKANPDRWIRCSAQFALACVLRAAGAETQDQAAAEYEAFLATFDGRDPYMYQGIEQQYGAAARANLKELAHRAVGKPAPSLEGVDLDGEPFRLADRRGRVVLLSFWGSWCFPCLKLVPHERALADRLRGRPFDIVGINCADTVEDAKRAAARAGMAWRSVRNEVGDDTPAITDAWNVLGFPTLYLIDHHGIIRKRWIGASPPGEFEHMADVLVAAAEGGVPADQMRPVVAQLPMPRPARTTPESVAATPADDVATNLATGFVDRVYRSADGTESRYVVYLPPAYDGSAPFPALLSLHGAGPTGTDGRRHLEYGLPAVIRRAGAQGFPFIVIFPQAREGENWTATNPGGQRALAILADALSSYRIDPDRIALTGVSMGGQGTWSLAAADPARWSAIVPLCHGGEATAAAKIKDVPCWCFHGAADRVIAVSQSRDMVAALQAAGGKPLYSEPESVGHNDLADHACVQPDLIEWLLEQRRGDR